ncbi:fibronectin type III domain-containing protein 4-like isoform X1 [Takifugu rubripes]|uniref:fibronectin type III domain-containing protein 4-like isoform X1 n=1 Tax=Takifugu rubripes TaxID=31033 RepID=UPI001145E237|nr:fibronectin type III domain-containing protein 4-like isoform X1 [Takifugu rubripes]XP_029696220.1 fibronectin type III domain-containing protein 4-like isoform X1 [Takifugu rubripes]XP_029696223.1 fibronectin type III domain-containing protein 4-like isoform X1 [Takifugu rubripes]
MSASALLEPGLLLLLLPLSCWTVGATVPAAPVNVSVTQLRSKSALVTWNVPQGDTVIGYSISQQRQDGLMQRSIREVNTSSHRCALWDLDEDTHYSVQVQSIGPHGDSQPSAAVHFRTLEKTDYPAGVLEHHEPAMEGLSPHLQTGELLIITTVLLLWAAVIALFCRQYDIIKDSESTSTKEKTKRPLGHTPAASFYHTSASGSPVFQNGAVPGSRVTQSTQTFHQSPGNACYHSSAAFKSCSRGEQVL